MYQKFRRDGAKQGEEVEGTKREWCQALVFEGQVHLPVKTHSYAERHDSQDLGKKKLQGDKAARISVIARTHTSNEQE